MGIRAMLVVLTSLEDHDFQMDTVVIHRFSPHGRLIKKKAARML